MKHVKNATINHFKGKPLKLPKKDDSDEIEWEDRARGIPVMEEATVAKLVSLIIESIPRDIFTRQDSIHCSRLWTQAHDSLAKGTGVLDIEDTEWDWLLKQVADYKVGAMVFGASRYTVESQLREFEKESN